MFTSIIIPVYKVEKYLETCVESVLKQTQQDFEIILVDDGSPDRCPQICDDLLKRDERIHVLHKQNGGLSSARNAGMRIAQGEYYFFLDSDDYLHPQTLEILQNIAIKESCDIVCSNYLITDQRKISFDPIEYMVNYECFSGQEALKKMYDPSLGMSVIACAKLYRSKLFTQVSFPEGCLHEDEFTTYKLYFRANKIAYIDKKLYYYYQNTESITRSTYILERLVVLRAFKERMDFFKVEKLVDPYYMTQRLYVIQLMEHYYQVSKMQGNHKEICLKLKNELLAQMKSVKYNPYFLFKHKLSHLAFILSPALFHYIYEKKISRNIK